MARLNTLADIEAALWAQLAQAAHARDHAWRTAVLATTTSVGDQVRADARTIVLRDVDTATRSLLFYTDSRSPKAQQISAHGQGCMVLWSQALSWQLRLQVRLEVQTSGLAVSSRWARLKMSPAAQDYLSPLPPGSALAGPQTPPQPERGTRDWFSVVTAQVESMDWLELHPEGHRRAVFDDQGARWVTP